MMLEIKNTMKTNIKRGLNKKATGYGAVAYAFTNQVLFPREMTLQIYNSCTKKQIFYQKTYLLLFSVIIIRINIQKNKSLKQSFISLICTKLSFSPSIPKFKAAVCFIACPERSRRANSISNNENISFIRW